MLSHLDCIIFPDRCEVIEVIPSQRYVYPIFKNGQSSIQSSAKDNNWHTLINQQIKKCNTIDIFLRDPGERLISGISSFIHTTLRDQPNLDPHTIQWFAENYLYLNRHYATQFLWIVNLARYMNPECRLNFLGMDDLKTITDFVERPYDHMFPIKTPVKNQEMYERIDKILIDSIGSSMTFSELITLIQQKDTHAYEWVIGRSQRILNPTYVLPKT